MDKHYGKNLTGGITSFTPTPNIPKYEENVFYYCRHVFFFTQDFELLFKVFFFFYIAVSPSLFFAILFSTFYHLPIFLILAFSCLSIKKEIAHTGSQVLNKP